MSVEELAEDIAVVLAELKTKDGLATIVKLDPDYGEHLRLCLAAAHNLWDRGYRQTTIVRQAI